MDDFEYSLEISDRDWECFFAECEECNLLPPSIAHVDDSGMSDFDDTLLTQRAGRVYQTLGSPVNNHPVGSPPKRGDSPPVASMDDVKQDTLTSPESFCTKWSYREDKMSSPEESQLISPRRKRRRKRRLSLEAGEGGHPCERHSKEDHLTVKEGRRLFLSTETLDLKEHKNLTYVLTPNPATIKFPENFSAQEIKIELSLSVSPSDTQCQPLQQKACTGSNYITNHTPRTPLSQSDDTTNDAANSQPNGEFRVTESPGLTGNHPCWPVSAAKVETEKSKGQRQEAKSANLPPSDDRNVSTGDSKNEQYEKHSTAQVKSITRLPCAESCAPAMEVVQNGKPSTAKSDLAAEAGNSGPEKCTVCQSDSESQEQLESDGHNTNQSGTTLEETPVSVNTIGGIASEPGAFQDETLDEVISTYLTSELINKSANQSYLSGSVSGLDVDRQTDSLEVPTSNVFSEKHKNVQMTPISNLTRDIQTENLQTTPPDITHVSCRPTLDSEPALSLPSDNKFPGFCSDANEHESVQVEKEQPNLLADQEANHTSSGSKNQEESKSGFACEEKEVVTASKDVDEPGRMLNSVFAMSSFWREMEKLTINDILGLRNFSTIPCGVVACIVHLFKIIPVISGLDAPLLPLKQSDMCLVCIAFASWVLKTANPEAGDAWKAVLLANVSALSAIRYLRKYVKVEPATSETKPHYPALTES
uniref:PPARGC1 and ESRR induced regulator, muscle 1 n=1 Tax=Poecilia latipinna TaxID=48699 RepID=A0A3B3US64_9TELE